MSSKFWVFLAMLFAAYGFIIFGTGLYYWLTNITTYATELRPSIWWGLVMLFAAILFLVIAKCSKSD